MNLFSLIVGIITIVGINYLFAFIVKTVMKKSSNKLKILLTCCTSLLFLMTSMTLLEESNSIFLELLFACCVFELALYMPLEKYMNFQKKNKKEKNKKEKNKNFLTVSIIFNVIFILTLIFVGNSLYETKKILNKKEEELLDSYTDYHDITDGYTKTYVKDKLDFFDENIVFVIEGTGKYYSDYNCMIQRTRNGNYEYLAFNKEAAIAEGYKKYTCNK